MSSRRPRTTAQRPRRSIEKLAESSQSPHRSKCAVFVTSYLQYSQTFIYEQLRRHDRYEPHVFTWRTLNLDRFRVPRIHKANPAYGLTRYSHVFHRSFKQERFDIVHAHFAPGAVYALPYARRYHVPLVVTFHGYDVPLYWNTRRFSPEYWPFLWQGRRVLEEMTVGLCASRELKELLISLGVEPQRLVVHYLGVDLNLFHPVQQTDAENQFVFVGRLVEKKGVQYALRAFAPHAKDARLTIVGDGPLMEELRRMSAQLGIAASVEFTGALPSNQVAQRIRRATALVAPSVVGRDGDRESGLIVAKEASACGVPVVATVHGGLPDIVEHGVTGFLAPERDVDRLSDFLGRILHNRALRAEMGAAARRKMEREYDAQVQAEALERIYDQVRRRRGGPSTSL